MEKRRKNTIKSDKHNRLYRIWAGIRRRCNNPNVPNYKDYGGRGIKVCNEWNSFENFEAWARSNGYADNLSIDRIDTNGDYCPENCRWATDKEQANNKRNNKFITFNGKTQTMKQWAEELGINYSALKCRLQVYGWDIEKALEKELNETRGKQYTAFGKTQNIAHWAKEYGINRETLALRLRSGWTIEEALTKPIQKYNRRK